MSTRIESDRPSCAWVRVAAVALTGVILVSTTGCKHRRSALRPIYAAPAPTVVLPSQQPCAGADCPPVEIYAPGFDDGYLSPSPAPSTLAPIGSSVAPRSSGEPPLDPDLYPEVNDFTPTSRSPQLSPLRETRGGDPSRRIALRSRVRGFANDPNDLFEPPRADRPWRYIVIHHSDSDAGSYAEIDRLHRERLGTAGCGYHFVIGNGSSSPDGQIEVTQRWSEQKGGAHSRNAQSPTMNDYGIGVCLVGDLDKNAPTERQVEAARSLVAYLQERYVIPDDRVGSHSELAATPTVCPGKHFPVAAILGERNLASR